MTRRILHALVVAWLTVVTLAAPAGAQTGTLMPNPKFVGLDDNGNPLAAGLLYTYTAGTVTPLATYNDSDLDITHVNANPVVLDAAGRATVYLTPTSYKFILKTAAGVTVWTQDNVQSTAVAASQATDNGVCEGRITLTSVTPVTITDVTAATTVYFTPYKGNRCAIYDGTTWNVRTFTELNLALGSDTTGLNYDLFGIYTAGAMAVERLAWTNDTTRATALTLQEGVYVKAGDTTRRYLGTYRTTGAGTTEDSAAKRFVWNYLHRARRQVRRVDPAGSWNYAVATIRQANATAGNQIDLVAGLAEGVLDLTVACYASHNGGGVAGLIGIGEDSTTTFSANQMGQGYVNFTTAGVIYNMGSPRLVVTPAVGRHFYSHNEYSNVSGLMTFYMTDPQAVSNQKGGLIGWWES
jgi:hypothetical protein